MKIAVIGGVVSTEVVVEELSRSAAHDVHVYAYVPRDATSTSGYVDMRAVAKGLRIPHTPFRRVNDHADEIVTAGFDVIFVVGLSQLVDDRVVAAARVACIGFHPTLLPRGRGRAPIAWLLLNEERGAATFFRIEPGSDADSGPIYAQSAFEVERHVDDARSIEKKILVHERLALAGLVPVLPDLASLGVAQDESLATEYGVRRPEDGLIDWNRPAVEIDLSVRASIAPHPGAWIHVDGRPVAISRSALPTERADIEITGATGRVLRASGNRHLVQCGSGTLWVELEESLRVGTQLLCVSIATIVALQERIAELEAKLGERTDG